MVNPLLDNISHEERELRWRDKVDQLSVKFMFFEANASGLVSVVLIFVLAIMAMGLVAYRR